MDGPRFENDCMCRSRSNLIWRRCFLSLLEHVSPTFCRIIVKRYLSKHEISTAPVRLLNTSQVTQWSLIALKLSKYKFNQIKRRVEFDKGIWASICGAWEPETQDWKKSDTNANERHRAWWVWNFRCNTLSLVSDVKLQKREKGEIYNLALSTTRGVMAEVSRRIYKLRDESMWRNMNFDLCWFFVCSQVGYPPEVTIFKNFKDENPNFSSNLICFSILEPINYLKKVTDQIVSTSLDQSIHHNAFHNNRRRKKSAHWLNRSSSIDNSTITNPAHISIHCAGE